jgi:hypothetical protein
VPVAFRAAGAWTAWEQVFSALKTFGPARAALADTTVSTTVATRAFMAALTQYISFKSHGMERVGLIQEVCDLSADLLAFWLRKGTLYEPTVPLGHLLHGVDICEQMPAKWLAPPLPAVCIVPALEQRLNCSGVSSLLVFTHRELAPDVDAPGVSQNPGLAVSVVAFRPVDRGFRKDHVTLPISDPGLGVLTALEHAFAWSSAKPLLPGYEPSADQSAIMDWRRVLGFVAKVLLYLQLDDAVVEEQRLHSNAPRSFAGLGKRRREARRAEIEQLYDRYLVGPLTASDWAGANAAGLDGFGRLTPHWRRGHLRMQAHGPHMTLRKPIFVMPTVVRADRLAATVAAV